MAALVEQYGHKRIQPMVGLLGPNGGAGAPTRRGLLALGALAAATAGVALARGCSAVVPGADVPLVLYTGASPQRDDSGFAWFDAEMRQQLQAQGLAARVAHHLARPESAAMAPDMKAALQRRPGVLVAPSGDHATVALRLRAEAGLALHLPIVFASYPDPVRRGIVQSLARPGGLVTGVSIHDTWHAKRFEILRDAFPSIRSVGVLIDRLDSHHTHFEAELGAPARALGLTAQPFVADTVQELDAVMRSTAATTMDAWYIPPTWIAYAEESAVIGQLQRLGRPAMHVTDGEVARGALMAYEQQTRFAYAAMAGLAVRILGGEDAGHIPVQRPWRFTLSVRPRDEPAALRIHPSVVRRADRIY
jgi:putative tryptophan/tyrosine transport system substrate-binding protein